MPDSPRAAHPAVSPPGFAPLRVTALVMCAMLMSVGPCIRDAAAAEAEVEPAFRAIDEELHDLDAAVTALADKSGEQRAAAIAALTPRVNAFRLATEKAFKETPREKLPASARRPGGTARNPLFWTGSQVIQAAVLQDDKGGRWCVVVGGGGEQVSTVAWPVGSPKLNAIVSGMAFQLASGIRPPSRLKMPATQPASDGKTLIVEVILDGATQRASLGINSQGFPQGRVEGWPGKSGLDSGEVGRYGYRNVSVDVPPYKSFPHADHVANMRFMPDGRLAMVTTARLEVFDPSAGKSKIIDRSSDSKRFYSCWRQSPDGRYLIVPDQPLRGLGVADVLSGEQRHLADVPLKDFECTDYGFDSTTTVLMLGHSHLVRLTLDGRTAEAFDVITEDKTMKIVRNELPASSERVPRSAAWFSAARNQLAISHESGLFVLTAIDDGWSDARRLGDRKGSISMSPDARWITQKNGSYTIFDVKTLAPVAEVPGEPLDYGKEFDGVSWSADGSLVALATRWGRVALCTLDKRKLAVEVFSTSPRFKEDRRDRFCLSPDGKLLAMKVAEDKMLHIWRIADVFEQVERLAGDSKTVQQ